MTGRTMPYQKDKEKTTRLRLRIEALESEIAARERVREHEATINAWIENAEFSVFTKDAQGRYVMLNKHHEGLLGKTRDEALGKTTLELIPGDVGGRVHSEDMRVLQDGHVDEQERSTTEGGQTRTYVVRKTPIRNERGEVVGLFGITLDITQRKRTETEIHLLLRITQAIEEARDLATALRVTIEEVCRSTDWSYGEAWTVNAEGALQCSSAWYCRDERLMEFRDIRRKRALDSGVSMVGRVWKSRLAEWLPDVSATPEVVYVDRADAARLGVRAALCVPIVAGGQTVAVMAFYMTEVRGPDEYMKGFIASIGTQIGGAIERKRVQDILKDKTEDLARSNAELEQFAYVASHDLQKPLRMVSGFVQLLANKYKGQLDSDADEFISYALDGSQRMHALINDLLQFSRVGRDEASAKEVQMGEVLERALTNLGVAIEEAGAIITADPLPSVVGKQSYLVRLLQNIIGNAIKFRSKAVPKVHVSVRRQDGEWVFSVKDNGIGFEPRFAERIFGVFQRLHSHAEYPGTGIGLAICKKIVEQHGGRIWAESEPGNGASFYFTLPVVSMDSEADGEKV